jgi:hypothetical protein
MEERRTRSGGVTRTIQADVQSIIRAEALDKNGRVCINPKQMMNGAMKNILLSTLTISHSVPVGNFRSVLTK